MTTYAELIDSYLGNPSHASLAALREAILEAPNFRTDLPVAEMVGPYMSKGAYHDAIGAVRSLMPGALFSPSAHAALADAFAGAGHLDQAEREAMLAQASLDSIADTGQGTSDEPWTVLRASDAHDYVLASGKTPRSQVSVGRLERIVCTDSTVWFFDVSEALTRR